MGLFVTERAIWNAGGAASFAVPAMGFFVTGRAIWNAGGAASVAVAAMGLCFTGRAIGRPAGTPDTVGPPKLAIVMGRAAPSTSPPLGGAARTGARTCG